MNLTLPLQAGRFTSLAVAWADGERVIYRGWDDNIDGGRRPVLVVVPATPQPTARVLNSLMHEYSLQAELDYAWAARPIELVREPERIMLLLEDPGGEPLDRLLSEPMEVGSFLHLAISTAAALGQVHRRGIIHKDIKPANILVNRTTGAVKLTGFGLASRLPRERQAPQPPEKMAGTLAYMAPEQTGRMNRSIDSRSDLYALGVTLYQMLTGLLPFTASDPMELVHCHLARKPVPPAERLASIPAPVSAIIIKLLAKTAEERYQTAAGLEHDLRRCLADLEAVGRVALERDEFASTHPSRSSPLFERVMQTSGRAPIELVRWGPGSASGHHALFALGEHDTPDRLMIPEKLYGREREVETLLAAFDRIVESGMPELVLVSGYSGIGKSSVVNELHRVLVPPRGLFASGKFDQYKRDIPYSTLAQAFENLIRRLLGKSDVELAGWRQALLEALGPNAGLIVDLVPELKLIIGEQPAVSELPPQDAQRRFQLVFRRFIGVFARPEHPLALFLDDLQWLDAATLDLLEDLLTQPDVQHLLVIGAYRDNEVDGAHPLRRKIETIRHARARVEEVTLAPLTPEHLEQLIADTLRCEPERAAPLARLVHDKTSGNPFFVIRFLYALAEESLVTFDHDAGCWSWALNRIHAKGYTDNVVHLMANKLTRLPVKTQQALQLLACLGNVTEVAMLSIVLERSEEQVHRALWEAVRLELVERLEGSYRFVHDRVQEAAYSLIPEALRAEFHLRIGRLMVTQTLPEKREQEIFEIVNQLNRGAALIIQLEERLQLAELNLIAGQRAKASTAYASALAYFNAGVVLLAEDSWEGRHELIFALALNQAECEFHTGALAAAEARLNVLSTRAATTIERASVTGLQLDLYTTLGQSDRAIAAGLDYLQHLGVEWSAHPTDEDVRREYARIWSQLGSRSIEELVELSLMSDPAALAIMGVLTKVVTPALFTDANLASLAICRMVNLSLERGNSDGSCCAYVWLGRVAGSNFGDYRSGFRFGRLGYELIEQRGLKRFQARTYVSFGYQVMPWTKHINACQDLLRRAFETANKTGDLTFAAYSCQSLNASLLAAGDPLVDVQHEAETGLEFAQKAHFGFVSDIIIAQLALIRTLRGLTPQFGSFSEERFDEHLFERRLASDKGSAGSECKYWIRKLQARYFAGDYDSALLASARAHRLLWTSPSFFETAEYHFYGALSQAASWDYASPSEKQHHFDDLITHHRRHEIWAENCPENFENRAALVGAEIARIEGRDRDAMDLYEQAIRSARANGFVHNEGLANELAARFYGARGFEKIAQVYLRDARYCYLRWGALGKVRQLEELYPYLKEEEQAKGPTNTIEAPVDHLDLATVIKVSQAVSGEIVVEKLLDVFMRSALEHAGAERGLLILPGDTEQRIAAEATLTGDTVIVHLQDEPVTDVALPESIVRYVVRTREAVVLDDASAQNPFRSDPYIQQHHARSVLCLPLINQTRLGVLYLENNLMPHVFTPRRITVLKLLASQATIALENSRLYRDLEQSEELWRAVFENNPTMFFMIDAAGTVVSVNPFGAKQLGYAVEELVGRPVLDVFHQDDRSSIRKAAAACFEKLGRTMSWEFRKVRKDGTTIWVREIGRAVLLRQKPILLIVCEDISERKQAEYLTQQVFENSPNMISIVGRDYRYRRVNPFLGRTWGIPGEQIVGMHVADLVGHHIFEQHLKPYLERCFAGEEVGNAGWVPFPSGRRFRAKTYSPLRLQGGAIDAALVITHDLTDYEFGAEELRVAQAELAHMNRVATMGQLTAAIAHEVNQPIAAAVTNAQAALRWLGVQPPELTEVRQALRRIVADGHRAGDVIDRIRTLIKKSPSRKERVQINDAILEVMALTRSETQKNGVSMQTQLTEGLPLIQGDRVQLQQVILNLVMNAMQAMRGIGEGLREIRISTSKANPDGVLVTVRDSGPGLSGAALDHLFEAFYTTKADGLGMGLSICRSIIEAHGGELWASANVPRGAVFQFTLPVCQEIVA